jgi:hypothetical protein
LVQVSEDEMNEVARTLNAKEVIELIGSHITAFLDGGPNRKDEDIELGEATGIDVELISARWDEAERQVRVAVSLTPIEVEVPLFCDRPQPEAASRPEPQPEPATASQGIAQETAVPSLRRGLSAAAWRAIGAEVAEPNPAIEGEPEGGAAAALSVTKLGEVGAVKVQLPAPSQSLTVQPDFEPRNASEYAIKEMNDKHAIISNLGGKCVVMEWVPSAITEGGAELGYQSFTAFKERYLNRYV